MRYFVLFICLIVTHLAVAQNHLLDSLYSVLENHPQEDSVRVNILTTICYKEYTTRPDKNKVLAEEALRISTTINFPKGEGYANRYIALYYWSIGDYGQASEYAYKMLRVFERISFKRGMGQAYQLLGVIHTEEREFEKARDFYMNALEIYLKENQKRDVGYAYNSLGSLYWSFSKYDQGAEYYLKSLKVREEINDEDGLSQTYGNLGLVYLNQAKYAEALSAIEKAIHILLKLGNQYRLVANYANLGKLYRLTGNYDKSEFFLLKSITIAKQIGQKKEMEEIYDELVMLEKERGRFAKALTYSELKSSYRDSIYTEEKARQIADVEARYETEKKDQMIQLLERDRQIQGLWTNMLVAAIALLVILAVVIYLLQRYREKKNRLILNLEIDNLTTQHKELSEKYKSILTSGNARSAESVDQRLLKKAFEIVEQNISDPLFGVDKMARELGMSRTNMHRKIKAITGFPPSELIRSIRLRRAAALLLNESDTVSQISIAVGFEDHSYFSKAFKKQFGVPPSEYLHSTKQVEALN